MVYVEYGDGEEEGLFDQFEAMNVTTAEDLARPAPEKIMRYPSQVLDLAFWKITLPINDAEEKYVPELLDYSIDPWFKLVEDEDGYAVQFRANHGGSTTSGSSNPRSELRELIQNYAERDSDSAASWSNTDGKTHTMWIKQKVTNLTCIKPHVVTGQIHHEDDDVVVFRIEGHKNGSINSTNTHANIWLTDGDETNAFLVDGNYELGTVFTIKIISADGETRFEYNENPVPHIHVEEIDGCYFKLGNYTQSHEGTAPGESSSAYAETLVYDYSITHE